MLEVDKQLRLVNIKARNDEVSRWLRYALR